MVAQPTTEAKYIITAAVTNHAIWSRKFLYNVEQLHDESIVIWVDNKSVNAIVKNPVKHRGTKHIKVEYDTIREVEKSKENILEHCNSRKQIAYVMTKWLSKNKLELLRSKFRLSKLNLKKC